jgi:hypothetical protein
MSTTKTPTVGLPETAPVVTVEWTAGIGETETQEWPVGTPTEVRAKYEALKAEGEAGNNLAGLTLRQAQGRTSLVARFGRTGSAAEQGEDVAIVEELYAVDVIKDISEAPYFADLTAEQVTWIRHCVENNFTSTEITAEAAKDNIPAGLGWASWSDLMKNLRYHMVHGVESYYETAFVLRRSLYGVRTSAIKASFTGINTVVTAPTFVSQMDKLIAALPSGEWLYKPPQAEHLGRGKWRITREWQWANKWSIVYGGTWNGTV